MIVVYDSEGRISYTVEPPYPAGIQTAYTTLSGSDPDFNYMTNGSIVSLVDKYVDTTSSPALTDRPELSLTYDDTLTTSETLVIDGLPEGSVVYFDGDTGSPYTPSTGTDQVEVTMTDPGVYLVTVDPPFPYKPTEFSVTVS